MDDEMMTTDQAAAELGVTRRRVQALIGTGRLKAKAFGIAPRVTYMIRRADLEAVRVRPPGRPKGSVKAQAEPAAPKKARGRAKKK